MKYVMFRIDELDVPVVFPAVIQHDQVVAQSSWGGKGQVVSAGHLEFEFDSHDLLGIVMRVNAVGKSISLKVEARPEDSDILTRYFQDW